MIISLIKKIISKYSKCTVTNIYVDSNHRVAEGANGLLALYENGSDDKPGQKLTEFKYKNIFKASNNIIKVENFNGKFGFLNCLGEEVWPCEFDSATDFRCCLSIVSKNGKFGIIHTTGRYILAPFFKQIKILEGVILADKGSIKNNEHDWYAYSLSGEELAEHKNVEIKLPPLKPEDIIKYGLQGDLTEDQVYKEYEYLTEQMHSVTYALMVYKVAEQQKKAFLKNAKQCVEDEEFEDLRVEQEQKLICLLHELFDYKKELD